MELSKEEQEAIEELKKQYRLSVNVDYITTEIRNKYAEVLLNLIEKLQKENEKQSKVIDEMAGYLAIVRDCPNEDMGANLDCENRCNNTDEIYEECWKQYFYRKVEEDVDN